MAKKFSDLRAKMSPESQARARARAEQMLAEMPLQALRRARELSQVTIAEILGASQPQISKIEHRTDLYVSTLRRYVEALGGELEIIARFSEGAIRIDLFREIEAAHADASPTDAAAEPRDRTTTSDAVAGMLGAAPQLSQTNVVDTWLALADERGPQQNIAQRHRTVIVREDRETGGGRRRTAKERVAEVGKGVAA